MTHEAIGMVPKTGPERRLFERAVLQNNSLAEVAIRISTLIEGNRTSPVNFSERYQQTHQALSEYTQALSPETYTGNWVDYFRVRHLDQMVEATADAPRLFSSQHDPMLQAQRERLITNDGIYGATGVVLEEALSLYHNGSQQNFQYDDYAELRGVINELTTVAVLNRSQNSDRLAVPSLITEDVLHATDAYLWYFPADSEQGEALPIQIKTSSHHAKSNTRNPETLIVTASDLRNSEHRAIPFHTAQSIVSELNATATPSQIRHLETTEKLLYARIRAHQAKQASLRGDGCRS